MRSRGYQGLFLKGLAVSLLIFGVSTVYASSANISHSYQSTSSIGAGSLVSLDASKSGYIDPANTDNATRLFGVAVNSSDSLIAIDSKPGDVQVATSGIATTLVSDFSGDINVGDGVTASPFNGIGMKATPGTEIVGIAQTALGNNATSEQVKNKAGQTTKVKVGYIRLSIGLSTAAVRSNGDDQLNALQKAVKALTGKTISTIRIEISMGVVLIAIIALITLIYAAIYGGIISVGRNPLAKFAIFRTLGSVLAMAIITAILAGVTVYFLLS